MLLLRKEVAARWKVFPILSSRGSIRHSSSVLSWRLSTELVYLYPLQPPQKQNTLLELSRMLPGLLRGTFRGGRRVQWFRLTEYFSQLEWVRLTVSPPMASISAGMPLSEINILNAFNFWSKVTRMSKLQRRRS